MQKIPPNRMIEGVIGIVDSRPANFGQFVLNNGIKHVRALIKKIFVYIPFLDTEFINLLNNILNSRFFLIENMLNIASNKTFEAYAEPLFEYNEMLNKIEEFSIKNNPGYSNNTS